MPPFRCGLRATRRTTAVRSSVVQSSSVYASAAPIDPPRAHLRVEGGVVDADDRRRLGLRRRSRTSGVGHPRSAPATRRAHQRAGSSRPSRASRSSPPASLTVLASLGTVGAGSAWRDAGEGLLIWHSWRPHGGRSASIFMRASLRWEQDGSRRCTSRRTRIARLHRGEMHGLATSPSLSPGGGSGQQDAGVLDRGGAAAARACRRAAWLPERSASGRAFLRPSCRPASAWASAGLR